MCKLLLCLVSLQASYILFEHNEKMFEFDEKLQSFVSTRIGSGSIRIGFLRNNASMHANLSTCLQLRTM